MPPPANPRSPAFLGAGLVAVAAAAVLAYLVYDHLETQRRHNDRPAYLDARKALRGVRASFERLQSQATLLEERARSATISPSEAAALRQESQAISEGMMQLLLQLDKFDSARLGMTDQRNRSLKLELIRAVQVAQDKVHSLIERLP